MFETIGLIALIVICAIGYAHCKKRYDDHVNSKKEGVDTSNYVFPSQEYVIEVDVIEVPPAAGEATGDPIEPETPREPKAFEVEPEPVPAAKKPRKPRAKKVQK